MPEHVLSRPDASRVPRGPLNWIYFPLALLYHELLLRAFDTTVTFFDAALLPIVLSALGGGLLLSLLANLLPWRKATRWPGWPSFSSGRCTSALSTAAKATSSPTSP